MSLEVRLAERSPGGDCPLCLAGLGEAATRGCGACATEHHAACLEELGGCATPGCRAQDPRPGPPRPGGQVFEAVDPACRECRRPVRWSGVADPAVGPCAACGEVGHVACREAHRAHCRGWGSIASERWASRASHAALVAGLTALVLPAAALVLLAALLVAWPLASREALRRLRRARGRLETSLRLMQLVALLSPLGWLCCPLWVLATARSDPDAPGAWRLWRPIDGIGEARGEVPRRDAARPNR